MPQVPPQLSYIVDGKQILEGMKPEGPPVGKNHSVPVIAQESEASQWLHISTVDGVELLPEPSLEIVFRKPGLLDPPIQPAGQLHLL